MSLPYAERTLASFPEKHSGQCRQALNEAKEICEPIQIMCEPIQIIYRLGEICLDYLVKNVNCTVRTALTRTTKSSRKDAHTK